MPHSGDDLEPHQWAAVLDAVEAVIDAEPSERQARLEVALKGHAGLMQHALAMLEGEGAEPGRGPDLADRSPSELAVRLSALGALPFERVGPYQLHRLIGRGGMGSVYLASRFDGAIERQVALKVVHPGLGTREVVARFELERHVQASLSHPGIAVLLDSGATEEGLPYLVLEYVQGVDIDRWCDGECASIDARLMVFAKVAEAVAHAHERQVIHRDLKPSNVLVNEDGDPKLLDFGIAKRLRDDGTPSVALTIDGMQRMTPAYASPEQLAGGEVTRATDIYSLGVLLFELLTGHTPHDLQGCTLAEIERIVCNEAPRRLGRVVLSGRPAAPSESDRSPTCRRDASELARQRQTTPKELQRQLGGDLERIVMMCLRKDPLRRYPSIRALLGDLSRFREGLPILARRDTSIYRIAKFIERNRLAVAIAAAVFLLLTGALAFSLVQYRRAIDAGALAVEQAELAQARFENLRTFRQDVLWKVAPAINDVPGALVARQRVLAANLACLEREEGLTGDEPDQLVELIESYGMLGRLQGHELSPNLGDVEAAEVTLVKAHRLATELVERFPVSGRTALIRAKTELHLGTHQATKGRYELARAHLRQAHDWAERGLEDATQRPRGNLYAMAYSSLRDLGLLEFASGDFVGGRELLESSLLTLDAYLEELPQDAFFIDGDRHDIEGLVARADVALGRHAEALLVLDGAWSDLSALLGSHPPSVMGVEMLNGLREARSQALGALGRHAEAAEQLEAALAAQVALADRSPLDARAKGQVIDARVRLGRLYMQVGDIEAARPLLEASDAASLLLDVPFAGRYSHELRRANTASALGLCLALLGEPQRAVALLEMARERLDGLAEAHPGSFEVHRELAGVEAGLGRAWAGMAASGAEATTALSTAARHFERALVVLREFAAADLGGVELVEEIRCIEALLADGSER